MLRDLLEELLAGDGSVGERVDGVHRKVRLSVVLLLEAFALATGPDGLHNHPGAGYLVLDIALQNATKKDSKSIHLH